MGIPVLTYPSKLYAGAISAALLEHFGKSSWIATSDSDIIDKARYLSSSFSSSLSRRQLQLNFVSLLFVTNSL